MASQLTDIPPRAYPANGQQVPQPKKKKPPQFLHQRHYVGFCHKRIDFWSSIKFEDPFKSSTGRSRTFFFSFLFFLHSSASSLGFFFIKDAQRLNSGFCTFFQASSLLNAPPLPSKNKKETRFHLLR